MRLVIKIESNAAGVVEPRAGSYIMDFDPNFGGNQHRGRGLLLSSPDKEDAKTFRNMEEALTFWRQQSETVPLRDDGEPNRPLTAYNISLEEAGGE